ncbi:hypothetical protein HOLDEFILI_04010 [Holdemania filiformis DSM 12042]|uniref:Uncharacterized protein n=1 Tax=Holdemania filiformis DSM 12042 TaxID=545696 RepID=B9YDT6_9FIRM|nr:hypothetical protein HOLDEFILI_04010 [Holdemania filiformis DSM 12042]
MNQNKSGNLRSLINPEARDIKTAKPTWEAELFHDDSRPLLKNQMSGSGTFLTNLDENA